MKAVLFLAFILQACVTYTVSPHTPEGRSDVHQSFNAANDAVVALFRPDGSFRCSGVWVADIILTAEHCVTGYEELRYSTWQLFDETTGHWTGTYWADVGKTSPAQDIATLVPRDHHPHTNAAVSPRDPLKGEAIFVFGHPHGLGYYYSQGTVVSEERVGALRDGQRYILHNSATYPGMSGGPVFNFDGDIIGITSFIVFGQENIAGATHAASIREFLNAI